MPLFKTPPKQLNARLVKHLNQLAKAGLDISEFDKKKILRLEEVDALLIQDINKFHNQNISQYDKIYPYLQALMNDLKKVDKDSKKYDETEKNRIKELVQGIATLVQAPKKIDEQTRQERLKQLSNWKFRVNEYPELASILINNWTQTQEIAKAAGTKTNYIFYSGLPAIRDIINEKTLPYLVEIAKVAGENTEVVFEYGLSRIRSIIDEKTLPYLVEIAKAAGETMLTVFSDGLPKIRDIINIDEKTLPYLVEIAKVAGEKTIDVFYDGLSAIKDIVNEKNLLSVGLQLAEIAKAAGTNAEDVFKQGFPVIRDIININEETLPYLVEIAKVAGTKSFSVFRSGLFVMKCFINEKKLPKVKYYFLHILKKTKGKEIETFRELRYLKFFFEYFKISTFPLLINPTVDSQGPASFLCFEQYGKIAEQGGVQNEKDLELLVWIVSKKQRTAPDILKNIIVKGLQEKIISKPISQDGEIIKQFLQNSPANLIELYVEFRNIYQGAHQDKHIHYEKLFKDVRQLKKEIISGSLTKNYDENILLGTLYSVFPPELTADTNANREEYKRVIENRQDRQSDIPSELNKLSGLTVRIPKGGFILKEEINTRSWNNLIEAVNEINQKPIPINPAETGMHILTDFLNGELRKKQKDYLKYIYSFSVQLGNSLPSFGSEYETLKKYKEFIGDRLRNDLIFSLLSKAQEKYKNEFLKLTNTNKDYRAFAKILFGIWNSKMKNKEEKIIEIINSKGFQITNIGWPQNINVDQINQFLITNSSNIIDKSLVQKIFNQLYGEQYEDMQKEMTKFEFKKEGRSLIGTPFKFILSKRRMHSVAMFNFGVCIADDDGFWDEPDMWQMIILDEEQNACGGVIYRTIEEGQNRYLIASIQPNSKILASVSPNNLYKKIIQYSKTMVKKLGYTNLLIPTDPTIHSNRGSMRELIPAQQYPEITLKHKYVFSDGPYNLHYQEFYIV